MLRAYFLDETLALLLNFLQSILEEKLFVEDPGGLVSYLTNGIGISVRDEQDVVDTLLRGQLMQWIIIVEADLAEPEALLRKNIFLALPVVDDLDGDLVRRLVYVQSERLLPLWVHIARRLDHLGVLGLFRLRALLILIDEDFDHGLESVRVKELIIELAVDDVKV